MSLPAPNQREGEFECRVAAFCEVVYFLRDRVLWNRAAPTAVAFVNGVDIHIRRYLEVKLRRGEREAYFDSAVIPFGRAAGLFTDKCGALMKGRRCAEIGGG